MASSRSSTRSSGTAAATAADEEGQQQVAELRRGPWTVDEDLALVNYITDHGEGRWNSLAQAAGLKRTGKSCRLRWLNYLRPDVKRGNFTADEQLLILDLHSRYGNRWSKIAQHLPGRTDNEIKNYWRTRVQKHAKQLNCDANSRRFKDAMRYLWMPHLVDVDAAHHRRSLIHFADHQLQDAYTSSAAAAAAAAVAGGDVHMTSSSSTDSFVTTASESYDAVPPMMKKWDHQPMTTASYDGEAGIFADVRAGEMLAVVNGGSDCNWVQETNQAAGGMMWCDDQKAQVINNGGQVVEDPELSGWVQSFSEGGGATENFWTLEDIWKMQ